MVRSHTSSRSPWCADNLADLNVVLYQPTGWLHACRCMVVRQLVAREGERDLFLTYTVFVTFDARTVYDEMLTQH